MDPQIRNFRDFLQLHNKMTEMCFTNCVDNFFNRNLATEESSCLDKCVQKFARVNQRVMNVYVEVQSAINVRRMAEIEEAAKKQQENTLNQGTNTITEAPNTSIELANKSETDNNLPQISNTTVEASQESTR